MYQRTFQVIIEFFQNTSSFETSFFWSKFMELDNISFLLKLHKDSWFVSQLHVTFVLMLLFLTINKLEQTLKSLKLSKSF